MDKKRKQPKGLRPWFLLGFLFLFALSIWFLLASSFFRIRYVNVEGNALLSKEEVVAKMGPIRGNLFLFSTRQATGRLLQVPGIDRVRIQRSLPNRLNVEIEEAYLLGHLQGKTDYYLDNKGVVLSKETQKDRLSRLDPLEILWKRGTPQPGKVLFQDPRELDLLKALFKTRISDQIQQVCFDNTSNIDIMYKNIAIHFGEPDNIFNKIKNLTGVLQEISDQKIPATQVIMNQGERIIVVKEAQEKK